METGENKRDKERLTRTDTDTECKKTFTLKNVSLNEIFSTNERKLDPPSQSMFAR